MSWYVTVDMQLTVIGFALLLIVSKKEKLGMYLAVLSIVISSVVTFLVVYLHAYNGIMLLTFK